MRDRGQGTLALVVAAVVALGATAAERRGPAAPVAFDSPTARSIEWLCPHGGGKGWAATIAIANPGSEPVQARLRSLGDDAANGPVSFSVPPGGEVRRSVPARDPASATSVEIFGGWASAGWIVQAPAPLVGIGAEPCAPAGGRTWYTTASSTQRGDSAFLVVMNPYAAAAVFDVTVFQSDEPPYRDPDWTDVELKAGRSISLPIHTKVPGKDVVAAQVVVKTGRVGVATLEVNESGGVASVLGTPATASSWALPTSWGSGQSSLLVLVPGQDAVAFTSSLLTEEPSADAGGQAALRQTGQSAQPYPVVGSGPTAVAMTTTDAAPVVTALRSEGQSDDDAATGGIAVPGLAWVVPPTVAGELSFPGVVVANPQDAEVEVTLRLLDEEGTGVPATFTVAAGATLHLPASFLAADPNASVLVTASAPVFAAGASTSGGVRGLSLYAIAAGIPVPAWAVPGTP